MENKNIKKLYKTNMKEQTFFILKVIFYIMLLSSFIGNKYTNIHVYADTHLDEDTNTDTHDVFVMEDGIVEIYNRAILSFTKSIFPVAFVILLVGRALAGTNENLLSMINTALKYLIIITLLLNCINLILKTVLWVVELTGSSSLANFYKGKK